MRWSLFALHCRFAHAQCASVNGEKTVKSLVLFDLKNAFVFGFPVQKMLFPPVLTLKQHSFSLGKRGFSTDEKVPTITKYTGFCARSAP